MDNDPERHEHNMARWKLAGSIGVVLGPLALTAAIWDGLGWRGLFWGLVGKLIPLGVGMAAQQWGLGTDIWLLLLGPVALWVGLPRRSSRISQ